MIRTQIKVSKKTGGDDDRKEENGESMGSERRKGKLHNPMRGEKIKCARRGRRKMGKKGNTTTP